MGTTAAVYLPAEADVSAYEGITDNGEYLTVPSGSYIFAMEGAAFPVNEELIPKPSEKPDENEEDENTGDTGSAIGKGNLALHGAVFVSSTITSDAWNASKLTDGDRFNLRGSEVCGWTSNFATALPHEDWFGVDLGAVYEINEIHIMPAGGTRGGKCYAFPKSFALYVSEDGEYWTEVAREENYPIPTTEMQIFAFAPVSARYIRFVGTELRTKPTDSNKFRMQIAEIEVYNTKN